MQSLLAALLVASAASAAAETRAGDFDWRTRGVLFRVTAVTGADTGTDVVADVDAAANTDADADDADAAATIGVDATLVAAPVADAMPAPSPDPSYLFATIHYGNAEQQALYLAGLRARLLESRVLVNEISGAEQWRPEYKRYRRLAQDQSLRALLGEAEFAELQVLLPHQPAATLDGLKPWVAMSMLEMPGEPEQDSIDVQLEDWAHEGGLRVLHLENLPEQLAALDCVPAGDYALVLAQRLRSDWSFEEEAARTLGYYRRRDLPAWYDEIERMPGLEGAAIAIEQRARHCLIEARNARWLPVLERLLHEGDCFVAVGAIHLTGDHGLLVQLSRRGFAVTVEPW